MSRSILLKIIIFSFLVGLISCNENSANSIFKSSEESESKSSKKNLDTIPNVDQRQFIFEKLVHRMDSLGFESDTTYFDESMYFEGVFHYANYESYFIHDLLKEERNYGDLISVDFKKEYDERFSRVTDIKLYPWRMPNTPEGRMINGVVELWTFKNTTDAEYVFEFLENELKHQGFPFIKTRPYYFQCGKWVYMFHSPDTGVSYRHEQFYDWMKKECK